MLRALILIADGFDDDGLKALSDRLGARGFAVTFVGAKAGATYAGAAGSEVMADLGYLNANLHAYALVVAPDGAAGAAIAGHKSLVNILYSLGHKGRAVAAAGSGVAALLAAAAQKSPYDIDTGVHNLRGDLVKGRRVAAPADLRDAVEKAGGRWTPEPVAADGPVVTASSLEPGVVVRFVDVLVPAAERHVRAARVVP